MVWKRENIQWAAVVWMIMPCWCQRSEENGQTVRDDRKTTVIQITTRYNQDTQNTISEHTTHQTLKQMDSSSRRPHRVPLLSAKNSTRRLQFTQDHQNWTIEDCKNVAWSDYSLFLLQHSDGVRIWCKEHESMDPSCLVSMVQAAGGGVMVWGIFSWHTFVVSLLFLTDHTLSSVSLLTSLYSSSSHYLTRFTTRAPSGAVSHYMYYSKQLLWIEHQILYTVLLNTTTLVPIEHRLNATVYLSIVADHVHPFMTTVYHLLMYFQQDNAPCHKDQIISDWFLEHDDEFTLLKWPPQSPDLSPIEHLWDVVEREIHIMDVQTTNLQQLCDAIMPIWTKIWGMFPTPCWIYATKN